MRTLRENLKPWLGMPAAEFGKADLRAARDAIVERGSIIQGNRLLAYLGPVLRWAAQEDLIAVNFVPAIRRAPERKREKTLSDREIAAVWRGCDKLDEARRRETMGAWCAFCWSQRNAAMKRRRSAMATSSRACGGNRKTKAIVRIVSPCRRLRSRLSGRASPMRSCFRASMARSAGSRN